MSRIDHEIEDCLIRLENQMYGFAGIQGRSASADRFAVEDHIRDLDGYERDARRENVELKVKMQSLEAERDRLRETLECISKLGAMDGLNAKMIARKALEN